uniref:Uncharacterized protein n=1 Tax=mine drainage metagenome TaxID=410659 RepID=E6QMM8_9ZZZZ
MSGNIGLRSAQHVLDIATAQLAMEQEIENPKSILVGQSLEV